MTHRRHKPDWRRGLEALRKLIDDPDSTKYAFELVDAVDPDAHVRYLRRLRKHPEGRRLLEERRRLADLLCDREALARMPEGSFGRAYLEFIEKNHLDPAGLIELRNSLGPPGPPDEHWICDRSLLMHDLWHVLTGCDTSGEGEAELLPFSWAQNGSRANALLTLGTAYYASKADRFALQRRMLRSWRRGRRAAWLPALPYEELLPQPLEDVRRSVGLR